MIAPEYIIYFEPSQLDDELFFFIEIIMGLQVCKFRLHVVASTLQTLQTPNCT